MLVYLACMFAVGYHLSYGWPKAVKKMGLPRNYEAPADALGQWLIWPLCGGFCAAPLYVLWLTKTGGAGAGGQPTVEL